MLGARSYLCFLIPFLDNNSTSANMDMSGANLNEAEQEALGQIMQRRMVQDLMRFVNGLTQQCFERCVSDFSSKELSDQEVSQGILYHTEDILTLANLHQ